MTAPSAPPTGRIRRWQLATVLLALVASAELALLVTGFDLVRHLRGGQKDVAQVGDDAFEAFESIAFAREFSERFQTFDAQSFRASQIATAMLLDPHTRAARLSEIERLSEKVERRNVQQVARLTTLVKLPGSVDKFRADLVVDLTEGSRDAAVRSRFRTRMEFTIERTERTIQNNRGFQVRNLVQEVVKDTPLTSEAPGSRLALRKGIATLVRFPCSIENVELPKLTPVRVKLTTLDISELQMRTETEISEPQKIRAVCRDRLFEMWVVTEPKESFATEPLVLLRALSIDDASIVKANQPADGKSRARGKRLNRGVEKSIEEQLGFVVEEE